MDYQAFFTSALDRLKETDELDQLMTSDAIIDSYVSDVVRRLPRREPRGDALDVVAAGAGAVRPTALVVLSRELVVMATGRSSHVAR